MQARFIDQVVMVTGSARGAGRGIALAFAHEGAQVVLVDVLADLAQNTEQEVKAISPASSLILADISKDEDIDRLFAEILSRYGRLDVAVNNAFLPQQRSRLVDLNMAEFDAQVRVNLRGTFQCMQRQMRIMRDQCRGAIVNITSLAGHVGLPNKGAYSAVKHAVEGLTRTAALEMARDNVRITALSPGAINSPGLAANQSHILATMSEQIPLGRMAEPTDLARGVMFLASEDATLCIGQTLHMNGGLTAIPREWW